MPPPPKFNPNRKPKKLTGAAARRIYTTAARTARNAWKAYVSGGKKR
jgi:hypothetical protein